jgi:hypothetical protein
MAVPLAGPETDCCPKLPEVPQGFIFIDRCWFLGPSNSVFEQQYGTLASLRPPETSACRIDLSSTLRVFWRHPPGLHFPSFYVDCLRKSAILGRPSKSNGPKTAPIIRQETPKCNSENSPAANLSQTWNRPAPERPPEASLVTLFLIFKRFWNLPDLVLNDSQCFLAPLLALNSGTVFAQSATRQTQFRTPAPNLQETSKEEI